MKRYRRAISGVAAMLIIGGLLAINGPGAMAPASAGTAHFYAALGDSYSSGEGTYLNDNQYDPGTTGDCHRSDLAWPRMLAAETSLNLTLAGSRAGVSSPIAGHIACSGAATADLLSTQIGQLGVLTPKPDLATVTIGGNDAGFSKVARTCYVDTKSKCESAISDARKKIETLGLSEIYRKIRPNVANGRLVVVGYPRLFDTSVAAYTVHCPWASFGTLGKMNDLIVAMDNRIKQESTAAGVEYVDILNALKDHELCTDKSWVRSITVASGLNKLSAHPLQEGQAAIKNILAGYLRAHPVQSPPGPPPAPANKAPVAAFGYTRVTGSGNRVTLDGGASSDPDGSITAWSWSSGGRQIATGRTATVSFAGTTAPLVTLTVTDNKGATAALTKTLSLPNRAPTISTVSPKAGTVVPSTTPSVGVDASDSDGDALTVTFRVTGPAVGLSSGPVGVAWTVPAHRLDPGTTYQLAVTVRDPSGATASASTSFTVAMLPTAADVTATSTGNGYWQVDTYGGVFSYGDAQFHGSLPGLNVRVSNIIGMTRTPDDGGYWLVGNDGGVFALGDAGFYGSMGGQHLNGPVVGMAVTPSGKGYWLAAADGGVFAFGDAGFYGSMAGKPLNGPVTAIGSTAAGHGYWLAAADGGVFAFGDAGFYGSMGGQHLNAPIVDMDVTPNGGGYWMTAEDGGVFAFGNAGFYGAMAGKPLNGHMTGMSVTPTSRGYWLSACDGGVFAFGDAVFRGAMPTYQCRGI